MNTNAEECITRDCTYLQYYNSLACCNVSVWDYVLNEVNGRVTTKSLSSLYVTPRRKNHCKEMCIFEDVSGMEIALNWDKSELNSLLRKSYYHENNEYFCISGTVTRTEDEVVKSGIPLGRSLGRNHCAIKMHKFSLNDAKNTVPVISTPTMIPNSKLQCLPAAFRDRLFSAVVTPGNSHEPTKLFVLRIIKREELEVSELQETQFRTMPNKVHPKWCRAKKTENIMDITVPVVFLRVNNESCAH